MSRRKYVFKTRTKIFVFLLFLGYFFVVFIKQEAKMNEQYKEIAELEQNIATVEEETQDLDRMIRYTDSEEYMERVARERLGWVKKGEIIFIEKKNK